MFVNAPSFRIFANEIIILCGIIVVKLAPQKTENARDFFKSLEWLLIVMMPSIALADVLDEIQIPWHMSILVFVLVFVGWAVFNWIKSNKLDKWIFAMFVGVVSIPIFGAIIGYCFSHGLL